MRGEAGVDSGFGPLAAFLLYFLARLGFIGVALGIVLVFMERLQIMERLEEHLQRRRDNDQATPRG
jgi:hypothetical protein